MSILLAGGTGVIGQALLDQASHAHNIITVGRRATERAAQEVVADFSNLPRYRLPRRRSACSAPQLVRRALGRLLRVDYGAVMSCRARQPKQRVLAIS